MTSVTKDIRARAESRFQKSEAAATAAQKARSEYEAEMNVVRKRTERLRALRLQKEEADRLQEEAARAALPADAATPVKPPARRKRAPKAG